MNGLALQPDVADEFARFDLEEASGGIAWAEAPAPEAQTINQPQPEKS